MPGRPDTPQIAQVLVNLPTALLVLFPDAVPQVTIQAETVAGMIAALDAQWPGMRNRLCDETPRIRPHLSIFCNGARATLSTPLRDSDEIYVLTAMSGG